MVLGFNADRFYGGASHRTQRVEGKPEKSFWTGATKVPKDKTKTIVT